MGIIRAIAFDLEGPIFDFEHLHFPAHVASTEEVLKKTVSTEWIIEHVPNAVGGGDKLISQTIAHHFGRGDQWEDLLRLKKHYFGEMVARDAMRPRPGFMDALKWYVNNGYKLAIGSVTPRAQAMEYIESAQLTKYIRQENIVLGEDVERIKPFPDVFIETARRMGIKEPKQLVIDDSPTGLEAARAAGSPSIATPLHRSHTIMADVVRQMPKRIIFDWREVNLPHMMKLLDEELREER